jgi:hypothetical protein
MRMDLQTLLRPDVMVRRVTPEAVPVPYHEVHSQEGLNVARAASDAAMDTWCEIVRKSRASGGFDLEDAGYELLGPYPCGKSPTVRASETTPENSQTLAIVEDELIVPMSMPVLEDDIIAVPGFFNQWRGNTAYAENIKVTPIEFNEGEGPYFICVKAGLSGATQPEFEAKAGLILDGSAQWAWVGFAIYYEVKSIQKAAPNMTRRAIKVQAYRG